MPGTAALTAIPGQFGQIPASDAAVSDTGGQLGRGEVDGTLQGRCLRPLLDPSGDGVDRDAELRRGDRDAADLCEGYGSEADVSSVVFGISVKGPLTPTTHGGRSTVERVHTVSLIFRQPRPNGLAGIEEGSWTS